MKYHVLHETHYCYKGTVTLSQQLLHMAPRDFNTQICLSHHIQINPTPSETKVNIDYFGNISEYFAIFTPHQALLVRSEFMVELSAKPSLGMLQNSTPWEIVRQQINQTNTPFLEATSYLYTSPNVPCSPALAAYAAISFTAGRSLLDAAFDLTQRIFREFEFDPEATDIATPLSEVLENKRGVCQDFAHLMIGCLRSLGLACRYVSGYILTTPPEGKERMIGADASHAWVSVFSPQHGWIDFDPTNNCLVQMEHITVAWGRDFSDISPMRGIVLGGGKQTLEVSVTVTPVPEEELALSESPIPDLLSFG